MADLQYYPTPLSLAQKARKLFKNTDIVRLLEPSAGRGDLLEVFKHLRKDRVDCIEMDFDNQAVLRGKGYNVVDADFNQFTGAALYSHIIMNPPFNVGCEHTLKAWNLLANGELVSIINAETLLNPYTQQRKLLVKIIEDYGSVEYLESEFMEPDAKRKTNVKIALVYLRKKIDLGHDFIRGLRTDNHEGLEGVDRNELAIKANYISNAVVMFDASVEALRAYELAHEKYRHYAKMLGRPLNQQHEPLAMQSDDMQKRYNDGYEDLKKRAWTNILHSTEFSKYLSSKAYNKLAADFDAVSKLSFTESNIRGFLLGLVQGQGEMNMQMMLDTFDEITKYRPENRAYYRGWKSNEKHREQAYRVQMTRFIIPHCGSSWSGSISYETEKKLQDFDKTFAMLDGKSQCETSLQWVFNHKMDELKNGKRVSSSYFDVRYYKGTRTIHFYPTNKAVIDRLNRLVGKQRQWLPQDEKEAGAAFWKQYEKAEEVTKNMVITVNRWGRIEDNESLMMDAHEKACEKVGLDISTLLEYQKEAA